MSNGDINTVGKKILFVYPNKPVLDNIVPVLLGHGYEPYILDDHNHTEKICYYYKNSIVFFNIDQTIRKSSWGDHIKSLKSNESFGDLNFGIISEQEPDPIITAFGDLPFNMACLSFLHGADFCCQVILNFLEKTNAKGNRKHVRVKCDNIYHASFSIKQSNHIIAGKILDISIVGMAGVFSDSIDLRPGSFIKDLQLRLMGSILNLSGKVAGMRESNGVMIYVIMFDPIKEPAVQHKVIMFISHMFQESIKPLLL